ncbi:MAG: NAD(P)-binding protein [Acidobacteria bacterium]|jgi:protoporphyrinogen oxidase|nr:NAD(P)-binding protein [Acidobacteriota bacterium]
MNVVIGAGISGLSAGQLLGDDVVILEKNAVAGGLAGQYRAGGFAFDYGGHYFHFQGKPGIKEHVEGFHSFRMYRRDSKILLGKRFIPYSLQYHLAYLPARLRRPILEEIMVAGGEGGDDLESFLQAHFGEKLFQLFFAPFMGKFYGRPLSTLLAGMDKGSIPVPRKEEVLAGARGRQRGGEGYNPVFYYPEGSLQGFIDDYGRPLAGRMRCNEEVVRIETQQRRVHTRAGSYRYANLVSTMPLRALLGMIDPPPPFPRRQLQHLSTLVVNVVLSRRRRRFHWLYLPEKRFPFYRAGYYPGSGAVAVYLEKTVAAPSLPDARELFRETVFTLRQTGMIADAREILLHDPKVIPVSYVVFDRNWPRLVPGILAHLRRQRIFSIGRYGSWNYSSMADDILMARETAMALAQS